MSVPASSKVKRTTKFLEKIQNLNSEFQCKPSLHRKLITEFRPIPRMKTVRVITKKYLPFKSQESTSISRVNKPFKHQYMASNSKKNGTLGLIDEISPIIPKSICFKNRLNESRANNDDTLALIFQDLSLVKK